MRHCRRRPWPSSRAARSAACRRTQWNVSGTLRSSPWTSSSSRPWLARSQLENSYGVAHRGRQQQQPHVRRQQPQRQLPDDAPLGVVEAVELVHHDADHVARSRTASRCSRWLSRISATTTRTSASGLTRRLPVTRPTSSRHEAPLHGQRPASRGTSARSGRSAAWCSRAGVPVCRASNRAASAISVLPVPVGADHHASARPRTRPAGPLPGPDRAS